MMIYVSHWGLVNDSRATSAPKVAGAELMVIFNAPNFRDYQCVASLCKGSDYHVSSDLHDEFRFNPSLY